MGVLRSRCGTRSIRKRMTVAERLCATAAPAVGLAAIGRIALAALRARRFPGLQVPYRGHPLLPSISRSAIAFADEALGWATSLQPPHSAPRPDSGSTGCHINAVAARTADIFPPACTADPAAGCPVCRMGGRPCQPGVGQVPTAFSVSPEAARTIARRSRGTSKTGPAPSHGLRRADSVARMDDDAARRLAADLRCLVR
jgi:hypothetical protein